jgi:hypothetical protein
MIGEVGGPISRPLTDKLLGDAIETFIRREDADGFTDTVINDEPELASYLRIEERELEAGC